MDSRHSTLFLLYAENIQCIIVGAINGKLIKAIMHAIAIHVAAATAAVFVVFVGVV